jgi:hypothetical protein
MLLGGKGGCQQCTCVPCNPCERTCTNPHTGTAFEAVYTRYFEGAEAGNTTDGYLTATGDSDTSDPYDGMDGTGPWYQEVAGTFTLEPSTTRHPCSVTVSFWRNNYVLGAATIPPPATTTTMNRIRVSVSASSETGVFVEGTYVAIGDTLDLNVTIPLVTGVGDQSTNDPRTYNGSATVTPECHNKTAIFTISGRIEWSVAKRQHVVYGLVRECYEIGTPCSADCSGTGRPDVVYVTISNFSLDPGATYYSASIANVNGTYALDRVPNICTLWFGPETGDGCAGFTNAGQFVETGTNRQFAFDMSLYIRTGYSVSGLSLCMDPLVLSVPAGTMPAICGTGVIDSGSSSGSASIRVTGGNLVEVASCTFDWEISA